MFGGILSTHSHFSTQIDLFIVLSLPKHEDHFWNTSGREDGYTQLRRPFSPPQHFQKRIFREYEGSLFYRGFPASKLNSSLELRSGLDQISHLGHPDSMETLNESWLDHHGFLLRYFPSDTHIDVLHMFSNESHSSLTSKSGSTHRAWSLLACRNSFLNQFTSYSNLQSYCAEDALL